MVHLFPSECYLIEGKSWVLHLGIPFHGHIWFVWLRYIFVVRIVLALKWPCLLCLIFARGVSQFQFCIFHQTCLGHIFHRSFLLGVMRPFKSIWMSSPMFEMFPLFLWNNLSSLFCTHASVTILNVWYFVRWDAYNSWPTLAYLSKMC